MLKSDISEMLQFFRELDQNNYPDWFESQRPRYDDLYRRWKSFVLELLPLVAAFDPDIARVSPLQISFRIQRDTSYSQDPTPYKTYFDIFLAPGGRSSMRAGYYFRLGPDTSRHPCRIFSGNCYYDPRTVRLLRDDISHGWEQFSNEVLSKAHPLFLPDTEGSLKRLPSSCPKDAPYAQWMLLRHFAIATPLDEAFVTAPNLPQRLAALFETTKPFVDYVNRAVLYDGD